MQAHIIFLQLFYFFADGIDQQFHQRIHFFFRPVPVLCRKGIDCQVTYTHLRTSVYNLPYAYNTFMMAIYSVMPALLSPTAITIHNDGYMPWQFIAVKRL